MKKAALTILCIATALGAMMALTPEEADAGCIACIFAGFTPNVTRTSHISCADADQQAIAGAMALVPGNPCATVPVQVGSCQTVYVDRPIHIVTWKVRYSYNENICL